MQIHAASLENSYILPANFVDALRILAEHDLRAVRSRALMRTAAFQVGGSVWRLRGEPRAGYDFALTKKTLGDAFLCSEHRVLRQIQSKYIWRNNCVYSLATPTDVPR